jgi:hypothetical protein
MAKVPRLAKPLPGSLIGPFHIRNGDEVRVRSRTQLSSSTAC